MNSSRELSQAGNEAVLRARFQDAQFFFQEDLKRPLADFRLLLAGTLFQKDLGTLLEKSVTLFFHGHACMQSRSRLCMSNSRTGAVFSLCKTSCLQHIFSSPSPGESVHSLALPYSLVLICVCDADAAVA